MSFSAPVLGIPVTIHSRNAELLALAESSFGAWSGLAAHPDLVEDRRATVTIEVDPSLRGADPLVYERQGAHALRLSSPGCRGRADTVTGTAEVAVSPAMLARSEQLRYTVIEAVVLFLLTGPNRYPVHAAAVVKDGRAVLLSGPSGAGKSTLAWTARGAGWDVLSDDIVYVQSEPDWRVWGGGSARSYFALGAERFVADLAGVHAELRAGGKIKYALARAMPMPPVARKAALCLVSRHSGATRLVRLSPDAAMDALTRWQEPGFDVFIAGRERRLRPLCENAWRLLVGGDPAAALPLIAEAAEALGAG